MELEEFMIILPEQTQIRLASKLAVDRENDMRRFTAHFGTLRWRL